MDNRILQVWNPIKNVLSGIPNMSLSDGPQGLIIVLKDFQGTEVKVIYDEKSQLDDWVWAYRNTAEIGRTDLAQLVDDAYKKETNLPKKVFVFFKMVNSDYIAWYDSLGSISTRTFPNAEHHLYMHNDGVLEIICDYEPRFIVNKNSLT